jgi:hypothetical protein
MVLRARQQFDPDVQGHHRLSLPMGKHVAQYLHAVGILLVASILATVFVNKENDHADHP